MALAYPFNRHVAHHQQQQQHLTFKSPSSTPNPVSTPVPLAFISALGNRAWRLGAESVSGSCVSYHPGYESTANFRLRLSSFAGIKVIKPWKVSAFAQAGEKGPNALLRMCAPPPVTVSTGDDPSRSSQQFQDMAYADQWQQQQARDEDQRRAGAFIGNRDPLASNFGNGGHGSTYGDGDHGTESKSVNVLVGIGSLDVDKLQWRARPAAMELNEVVVPAVGSPLDSVDPSLGTSTMYISEAKHFDVRRRENLRPQFVDTFRMSAPYITAYRGCVFVIHIPGVLVSEPNFNSVMADIAMLVSIGIRVALVLGPKKQVQEKLRAMKLKYTHVNGLRVTSKTVLEIVKDAVGDMIFEVESKLNRGLYSSQVPSQVNVVSGNFFTAQPMGIVDGIDYGYTGKVRSVNVELMRQRLASNDVLVLSSLGVSPSGEIFNCVSEQVAVEVAAKLGAEKIIYMVGSETLYDSKTDRHVPNLTLPQAEIFMRESGDTLPSHFSLILGRSAEALHRGVRRAHLLNRFIDGVLLMEIFHRDGTGLMLSRNLYEGLRVAQLQDSLGIADLLRPLEEQGVILPKSMGDIEKEISSFVVYERESAIIACAQFLYSKHKVKIHENSKVRECRVGEIKCVAVDPDYQQQGKGLALLSWIERRALNRGVRILIVHTMSANSWWFSERGYREVKPDKSPELFNQMSQVLQIKRKNGSQFSGYSDFDSAGPSDQSLDDYAREYVKARAKTISRIQVEDYAYQEQQQAVSSGSDGYDSPSIDPDILEAYGRNIGSGSNGSNNEGSHDDGISIHGSVTPKKDGNSSTGSEYTETDDEFLGDATMKRRLYVKILKSERAIDEEDVLGRL